MHRLQQPGTAEGEEQHDQRGDENRLVGHLPAMRGGRAGRQGREDRRHAGRVDQHEECDKGCREEGDQFGRHAAAP